VPELTLAGVMKGLLGQLLDASKCIWNPAHLGFLITCRNFFGFTEKEPVLLIKNNTTLAKFALQS